MDVSLIERICFLRQLAAETREFLATCRLEETATLSLQLAEVVISCDNVVIHSGDFLSQVRDSRFDLRFEEVDEVDVDQATDFTASMPSELDMAMPSDGVIQRDSDSFISFRERFNMKVPVRCMFCRDTKMRRFPFWRACNRCPEAKCFGCNQDHRLNLDNGTVGLATRALLSMKTNHGWPWIGCGDMFALDALIQKMFCPTKVIRGACTRKICSDLASCAVTDIKNHLYTQVLATVNCAGWRMSWALGLIAMLSACALECALLRLVAVKGGPATEGEIEFLELLLPELGFIEESKRVQQFDSSGRLVWLSWQWRISREVEDSEHRRSAPLRVTLHQFQEVTDSKHLDQFFSAKRDHAETPNLMRVAVISCPLKDKFNMPVHEILNRQIGRAFGRAMERAKTQGFMPAQEEKYREFMGLPH